MATWIAAIQQVEEKRDVVGGNQMWRQIRSGG
jgi:hypothetical protein